MSEGNGDLERSLEEINRILHLAKLNENDVVPISQAIYFSSEQVNNPDHRLLELDETLLEEIKLGNSLTIKGGDEEAAVLCTNNRTYDLVGAETSNSLLLGRNVQFYDDIKDCKERNISKVTIEGVLYEYLTVVPSRPYIKKLVDLLNKAPYKGPEHEYEVKDEDLYSYEELLNIIQSSEVELKETLDKFDHVITVNNKIRALDFDYHFRTLSYMLKLIEENSWPLDEIDMDETLTALSDIVPDQVITGLFLKYTRESKMLNYLQLYSYKEEQVCVFLAKALLCASQKFNLNEFLQAWSESVPEGMHPEEEWLYGIAIIDRNSVPNIISAFPEEDLPEDVHARFEILFRVKEKWTVPEIAPYIQRLTTNRMDVNAILAKYARASHDRGVKYYSAKHGK